MIRRLARWIVTHTGVSEALVAQAKFNDATNRSIFSLIQAGVEHDQRIKDLEKVIADIRQDVSLYRARTH